MVGVRAHKSSKIDYFFPGVDPAVRANMRFDDVAMYSVTDQRTADAISRRLLQFVSKKSCVANATACVGGNTWSFSKHFERVIAIERDKLRHEYLVHNMRILGARNVEVIQGDALHLLLLQPTAKPPLDLVFVDPPWGGPEYKKATRVSLTLSGKPLYAVVDALAGVARYVALKLPVNHDTHAMVNACQRADMVLHERFKKMHLVVLRSRVWADQEA